MNSGNNLQYTLHQANTFYVSICLQGMDYSTNAVCFILYNLHTGLTAALHESQCEDRYMCMNPMWEGSAGKKHLIPRV